MIKLFNTTDTLFSTNSALKEWQESNVSTLSMSSPLLGNINTIDLQPIESDIQPLEINEEIEPLEEGEYE